MKHRIDILKQHFGVTEIDQWRNISPFDVLAVENIGPVTLTYLRLFLAHRGVTLRDDQTPDYWNQHIDHARIGESVAARDNASFLPFTILVDSGEQHPFAVGGFSNKPDEPLICPTRTLSLGPTWGDYSIQGFRGHVHVERKSVPDMIGTLLAYDDRREAWHRELENLSSIERGAVVCEGSFATCLAAIKGSEHRSREVRQKTFFAASLSLQQTYSVPWFWMGSRRLAEAATLKILQRFFDHAMIELRNGMRMDEPDMDLITGML